MNLSKVNSYLLAGTAGVAFVPIMGLAVAPEASAAPPVPMSWAGWYVGLNAGVASESNYWNSNSTSPSSINGTHNGSVFIGGGQIGYNWQQGSFVYGLEGDFSGLSKTSGTYGTGVAGTTYGSHISWMSTIRGRLGMTVGDGGTLLYGTGGIAIAGIKAHSEAATTASWPLNDYSQTKVGWALGAGFERMLTPHWTIGLEGLFADFGSYTKASNLEGKCCSTVRDRVFIGRAKLNYKF